MRKLAFTTILSSIVLIAGCGKDDDASSPKCLVCTGSTATGETVCEGDSDPDSGETITLLHLELALELANSLGGDCSLE